ncbi:MAG: Gfo/Idh/MocA family oxidoreductase [Fimbriimonadaceae bacterium]|nr:Gfo/Idh/MocA family oxidoreductase [Fimbriimonadaceae bacterium]
MADAPLGIAVLGYAHGHVTAYTHQIKGFEDAAVVACWDHDEARAKQSGEGFQIAWSPHLEDIVGRSDVQAVIIGAETNRHADCVEAAAAAGLDIVLQKPMALSLADCDRIAAAVAKAGVRFSLAYQMRLDPMNMTIKELVTAGKVGRIGYLRRRHCLSLLFNEAFVTGPSRWHVDPVANMGMFMDDASHAADFVLWIMGMPCSVVAEIGNTLNTVAPDNTGVATYRWADGAFGTVMHSSVIWAAENTCEIYGDQGVIVQNHDDGPSTQYKGSHPVGLKVWTKETQQWEVIHFDLPESHGARISNVARPAVDFLLGRRGPICSLEEGRQSSEMILGAYRSAESGQRVLLPMQD